MTPKEFQKHCAVLRELGATSVTVEGDKLSATFAPPPLAARAVALPTKEPRETEPPDPKKARQAQRDLIQEMARGFITQQ